MKIIMLGVGEAYDEQYNNMSLLIDSHSKFLIDCGFFSVRNLWKYNDNPNFVDIIYISHFHADHYFGLAPLLVWMKDMKRKSPLTIISQRGVKRKITELLKIAYKKKPENLGFKIHYVEVKHGKKMKINEFNLNFARTVHSVPNFAVRIEKNDKSLCYSGDGEIIKQTLPLYNNCNLLVQEAYYVTNHKKYTGHACLNDVLTAIKDLNIKKLALVHINKELRRDKLDKFKEVIVNNKISTKVIIPKEMTEIEL